MSAYVGLAFSGTSLGSGAGEPKRPKSSMDLKPRFTEVGLFCVILSGAVLLLFVERLFLKARVFGMFPQVFSVNNVNVVIRTRTEHLTDEEKARIKSTSRLVFTFLWHRTENSSSPCVQAKETFWSLCLVPWSST